jgi:hypothetical protein
MINLDMAPGLAANQRRERKLSGTYEYGLGGTTRHWRELAIEHMPELREVILAADSHIDLWWSFKGLLDEAAILPEPGVDESKVKSIYDYAWWCFACSGDPDLVEEVGTYFYEDLPYYSSYEDQVPLFIDELQFDRLESRFRYRLSVKEFSEWRLRYMRRRESLKELKRGNS